MFTTLFHKKRLSLILFLIISLLGGIASWLNIPLEAMPKENVENFLYLSIEASQIASPIEQENRLAKPLEGIIKTLDGMTSYKTSVSQSNVTLSISYSPKVDLDRAYFDLLQSLQKLAELKIIEMKNVTITRLNPEAQAIIKISMSGNIDEGTLKKIIGSELKGSIESIPGIAKVDLIGLENEYKIFNIPDNTIFNLRLDKDLMIKKLNSKAQTFSIGAYTNVAEKYIPVNSVLNEARYVDLLQTNVSEKTNVPLGQIISLESEEKRSSGPVVNKNKMKAIFAELFAKDGADLFLIKDRLQLIEKSYKEKGVSIEFLMDKVNDLSDSLDDVKSSLLISILLTTIIVPLFLLQIAPALIIASVIPVSTLWTIILMFITGKTLNLLTLSGLILSVGMVVDNGIIVMERIQQLLNSGKSRVEAAAISAKDIFLPLLVSTLTNAAIFIPPTFIDAGDAFTDMLKSFRDPIVYSLITSFISALLVIPLLAIFINVKNEKIKKENPFVKLFTFIYEKRIRLLLPILILLIISFSFIKKLEESDIESPRDPFVSLKVKFTNDLNPEERKKEFLKLETYLFTLKKDYPIKLILSEYNPMFTNGTFSFFPNKNNSDDELDKLVSLIEKIPKIYETPVGMVLGDVFNFSFDGRPKFNIKFVAYDALSLDLMLTKLKDDLINLNIAEEIKTEAEENDSHSALYKLDQNKMEHKKIAPSLIAKSASLSDKTYAEIPARINGKDYQVKFITQVADKNWTVDRWNNFSVKKDDKTSVPLKELGTFMVKPQLNSLKRENGVLMGRLYFYLSKGPSVQTEADKKGILNFLKTYPFLDGQGMAVETSAINIEKARMNSYFIIGLSVFLIFIILAMMFESIVIPVSIIVSVPIAVIFGLVGLYVFNLPLDPMARLGLVILTGIAVNNSIVLVDVISEWRTKGFTRKMAIIKGCSERLLSVLMSTTCNIAGILPVALGQGKIMGIPYSSMGIVIITGLIGSTIVTLILLPAVYEYLEDLFYRQGTSEVIGAKS